MIEKKILIFGAGYEQLPAYEVSKRLGLFIIGIDKDIKAPGFNICNQIINTSVYNEKAIIQSIKKLKIEVDVALTVAIDIPKVYFNICKSLNIKNISIEAAKYSSNKKSQYDNLKKIINIPDFRLLSETSKTNLIKENKDGYIVKPIDGRGSRGVFYVNHFQKKSLKKYIKKSLKNTEKKKVIIQSYITGIQISTETLLINKKFYHIFSYRNYEDSHIFFPQVIENGGDIPLKIGKKLKLELEQIIQKIYKAYNLNFGPLKCDFVLNNEKFYLIEASSRFGGGYVASHVSERLYGVNTLELFIRYLCNFPKKNINFKFKGKYSSIRFFISKKIGSLKSISNFDSILKKYTKEIYHFRFYKKKGDIIKINSHSDRIGFYMIISNARSKNLQIINNIQKVTKINVQ